MKIELQPQECEGHYKFDGQIVYTNGFLEKFKDDTIEIIFTTLAYIKELVNQDIADYLQVVIVERDGIKTKFWVIDDIDHFTYLLPEEY